MRCKNCECLEISNQSLLKKNTELHALVNQREKELKEFSQRVEIAAEQMIRKYDSSIESVIDHLLNNKIISFGDNNHKTILSMLPVKLHK